MATSDSPALVDTNVLVYVLLPAPRVRYSRSPG